jgi:predicted negative regulator of RcsB-dependent stress response
MSEKTTESVDKEQVEAIKPIPENLPEELLPLYDWWKEKGARSLITAGSIALVAVGVLAFMHYRKAQASEANIQLTQANSVDELEEVTAKYGNLKAGNAARIRLAKAYYDASKYEDALAAYEECEKKGTPKGFEDIVTLGRAHSLEAMKKTDEALSIFKDFTGSRKDSFLYPQAVMGQARVMTMQGKKDEAKLLLEELKAEKTGEPAWEMTIANLEEVIDRYEPREERSLFDMADEAGKNLEKAPKPNSGVEE